MTNSTPLDLVVHADRVHTMVGDGSADAEITSIGIRDGFIVSVGTRADAADWQAATSLDLGDATITPGLTDAHIHPIMGAALASGVDLTSVNTIEEARAVLSAYAVDLSRDDWVLGWGLNLNVFGTDDIRGDVFDTVTHGLPMFLRLFDGHSALANPRALEIAGVTGPRDFGQASSIACDATGTPTGMLYEWDAMDLVQLHLPEDAPEVLAGRFLDILHQMSATGLTGGHAMDFTGSPVDMLNALEAELDLPLRLRFAPWCNPGATEADLQELLAIQGTAGRRWSVEGVKLFIDGTIDNGTAWLAQPDSLGQSRDSFWPDPASYRAALSWLDAHGVATATHSIGDAGIEYVLDTMALLERRVTHRVEHIETAPAAVVARFAALGVAASMQPTHCTHYTKPDGSDNWSRRLGPERTARGFPTRDIRDSGAILALGSDWPIAPFDPRAIMADAQLRRQVGHPDAAPCQPEQALTARMALEGYTSHAAASIGQSDRLGTIAPGRCADLTVFGADPLALDADDLADVPIVATLVDGSVQYRGLNYQGAL
ncbi:amidohydrolase [Leifsonia sp. A12D58]|uniref:amidohydrolase n=1 Tax=Leifsonia sp. A12D58 TaxID=3397674 RepID=UPI0039DFB0EA